MKHVSQRGMTLLETVIWIALFASAMFAIMTSVLYFYRTNNYALQQATAVASAQHGMDTVVKTLRETAYSSIGAYPIVSMAANDFVFYSNIDNDPYIEKVHFYVSGTKLYEGVVDPSGDPPSYSGSETTYMISDYIHNLDQNVTTFTYYDASGAKITDMSKVANVRFVTIDLVVNVDPNKLPNQLTLQSSTALRNLIY